MPIKIRLSSQKIYSIIVIYMISFMGLLSLTNEIFNLMNLTISIDSIVIYGCLYGLLVLGLFVSMCNIYSIPYDIKLGCSMILIAYLTSYFLYEDNRMYLFTSLGDY